MSKSQLTLRTHLTFNELADHIAHLLWIDLSRQSGGRRADAHRYPSLAHTLNGVLQRHVGACLSGISAEHYDAWSRTASSTNRFPACSDHERHLREEMGLELQKLVGDLENEISQFLTRHQQERALFDHELSEFLRRLMSESVVPYLCQHFAASCCLEKAA